MKYLSFVLLSIVMLFVACGESPEELARKQQAADFAASMELEKEVGERARQMYQPLATSADNAENVSSPEKIHLGKVLYFDKRLSKDGTQSCNSCHNMSTYGVDNLPVSPGDNGGNGTRNSPTVLNAAFHSTQFWDGRAKDVEQQAGMPITNPVEMAIPSEAFLVERLSGIEMYKELFAKVYPDEEKPLTYANIAKSIAAFERTLITPAKWDDYLGGSAGALTLEQKRGLKSFLDAGCVSCHVGSLLGGNMFQKFGVYGNYWEYTKSAVIDEGRFTETKNEGDKYMFKVPSLRNITETHPYFHDGSVADLGEAVKIMAKVNLNKDLTDGEVSDIVAFLGSLTGEVTEEMSSMPTELQ
ncbi:MAG: cytochrome-c peroxidase [Flavobacteriales bacterium]|jgi:cytochrome c peroxidase|nr:cytochrome-c peroxidase [Flavobacteriales bacterium]